jgi:hypothetical protein
MKDKKQNDDPTLAAGIDTEDELKEDATSEEVAKGDFTTVFTLSLDENDPS